MYLIVNRTKHDLSVGDLGIVLGPHKCMDLDRILDRHVITKSKNLKTCIKKGFIQVKQVSSDGSKVEVEAKAKVDDSEINKIKKAIRKEVKEEMQKQVNSLKSDGDVASMLGQIKNLLENQSSQKEIIYKHEHASENKDTNDYPDLDEDTLTEIHAKSQKKLSLNSESKVNYEENKSRGSIAKNVDELDDLLG